MPINPLPAPISPPSNIQVPAGTFGSQYGFLPLFGEGVTEALSAYFKGKQEEQKTEETQDIARQKEATAAAVQQSEAQYRQQDIAARQAQTAAETAHWGAQESAAEKAAAQRAAQEGFTLMMRTNPNYIYTPEGRDFVQQHFGLTLPTMQAPQQATWGSILPGVPKGIANLTPADTDAMGLKGSEIFGAYKPKELTPEQDALDKWFNGEPLTAQQAQYVSAQRQIWAKQGTIRTGRGVGGGAGGPSANHVWQVSQKVAEAQAKVAAAQAVVDGYQAQITQPGVDKAKVQSYLDIAQNSLRAAQAEERTWEAQYATLTGQKPPATPPRGVTQPGEAGQSITNAQVTQAYQDYIAKKPKKPMTLREYIKRLRDQGWQITPQ